MTVDEYENLIIRSNILNDMLTQRDIGVCFNQAMFTYVDEINQDKHLRMGFWEFLEAFARTCEKASHSPLIPIRQQTSARTEP